MRDRLAIPADAPVVVCAARMVKRKGQDTLVNAWPRVLDAVPAARLLLVGHGPARSDIERLAAPLGEAVVFTGTVPWITPLPPLDPTPPVESVIRTPLAMVTPPEDNLTRVQPLTPARPFLHQPMPTPVQPAGAHRLPSVQGVAFAAMSLLFVAVLAIVGVQSPKKRSPAAGGPAPTSAAASASGARSPARPPATAPPPAAPGRRCRGW